MLYKKRATWDLLAKTTSKPLGLLGERLSFCENGVENCLWEMVDSTFSWFPFFCNLVTPFSIVLQMVVQHVLQNP